MWLFLWAIFTRCNLHSGATFPPEKYVAIVLNLHFLRMIISAVCVFVYHLQALEQHVEGQVVGQIRCANGWGRSGWSGTPCRRRHRSCRLLIGHSLLRLTENQTFEERFDQPECPSLIIYTSFNFNNTFEQVNTLFKINNIRICSLIIYT